METRGKLPRLTSDRYRGRALVHWVFAMEDRRPAELDDRRHAAFREALLHALGRHRLACVAYCLLPDHWHLLLLGLSDASDQRLAVRFLRTHLAAVIQPARFQKQPYDHLLREDERAREALPRVTHYILANAVGHSSEADWRPYPFLGCCVMGFPALEIRSNSFWEAFWRVHEAACKLVDPTA